VSRRFSTVLVANRGEIALRVMRTARAMGYRTVAAHSAADAEAPFARYADIAVEIGPAAVKDSYLSIERIVAAARKTGADAVHPGYGFLSENPAFAQACADAGLVFIGPDAAAVRAMGSKRNAKDIAQRAGAPLIPGYNGPDQSDERLLLEAERIGFPLMVKASAGGGGRGLRLVPGPDKLGAAIKTARSEAMVAFGDDELILEKALVEPRHVEIQVFGDRHGKVIHLGERDCSVQRRHQKVIEEAPSPFVTPELRTRMGKAAVAIASEIGYVGAGTMEFLVDADRNFYFLEMNTRLQVEHPVTELITGLDLVEWQLRIAAGEPLPLGQDQIRFAGHAIEVRLYAEDGYAGFLPRTGKILAWRPAEGPGLRADAGIAQGLDVTPYYDPMLAKVMAHGSDREQARRRLLRALEETALLGVVTNKDFLIQALSHEVFASGGATTAFIDTKLFPTRPKRPAPPPQMAALAALLFATRAGDGWRSTGAQARAVDMDWRGQRMAFRVKPRDAGYKVIHGERRAKLAIRQREADRLRYVCDGVTRSASYVFDAEGGLWLDGDGRCERFVVAAPAGLARGEAASDALLAPITGRVASVRTTPGESVRKGQVLATLEAMKMEHEIAAERDGKVKSVAVKLGDQIQARALLIALEPLG